MSTAQMKNMTPPTPPLPPGGAMTPAAVAELEAIMLELIAHHERVLPMIAAHRAAIGRADAPAIRACILAQQGAMDRLSEIENRRRKLVAAVMGPPVIARPGVSPPRVTLKMLAERAGDPARGRLTALADKLRGVLTRANEQQRAIEAASASLLAHMNGLIAQIGRALSPTGLYARPGTPAGASVMSGLDVRS